MPACHAFSDITGRICYVNLIIPESSSKPSVLINQYNPLTQAGIAIRNPNGRTAAQNTELELFVEYLTDFTSPPTPDSQMITTLKKYCYSAP
jgi:hypothetical protein